MALRKRGRYAGASETGRTERNPVEEELQRSLLSAVQRMAETLGNAEGAARRGELHEAMVYLAAL